MGLAEMQDKYDIFEHTLFQLWAAQTQYCSSSISIYRPVGRLPLNIFAHLISNLIHAASKFEKN